jgi:hypothetical protein
MGSYLLFRLCQQGRNGWQNDRQRRWTRLWFTKSKRKTPLFPVAEGEREEEIGVSLSAPGGNFFSSLSPKAVAFGEREEKEGIADRSTGKIGLASPQSFSIENR